MRFDNRKDMAEEFNKLVQDKCMKEYVNRFE
jgi:predicted DNA-binding WGR domain protein